MCNSVCTGSSAFWEEHVDSLKWLDSSCPNTPHMYFSTVWLFDCFLSSSHSLSFDWSTPDCLPNKTIQFMSQTTLYNLQWFCVRPISNLILSTILSTMYVDRRKKRFIRQYVVTWQRYTVYAYSAISSFPTWLDKHTFTHMHTLLELLTNSILFGFSICFFKMEKYLKNAHIFWSRTWHENSRCPFEVFECVNVWCCRLFCLSSDLPKIYNFIV